MFAGERFALCLSVQPFGALSLKSNIPFALDATLGFFMRGSGNTSAAALSSLELQFENSSPTRGYTITRTLSLGQVLEGQAGEGKSKDGLLAAIAAGSWTPVKVSMRDFLPDASAQDAGGAHKADRLTIGSCLQNMAGCSSDTPNLDFCADRIVMVSAA